MRAQIAFGLVFALLIATVIPARERAIAGTGVCPENPSPPNAADPSMIVDFPAEGTTITSPVTVSGKARTFEANVRITLYDANGVELIDTFTTAAQAAPALSPFSRSVPFTVSTTQQGCVRVWEESAQDGSPRNVVQHEVTLTVGVTRLPSTGNGGPTASSGHTPTVAFVLGTMVALTAAAYELKRRA